MNTKILMVCLGNICRSPLAEGILKTKVNTDNVFIDSAGTGNYHVGQQPDERSIKIAQEHNIDITQQRGRQFEVSDFDRFDLIYVMDNSNYEDVLSLARNDQDRNKVHLILNEVLPNENCDVPDPYTGGIDGFKRVYDMLDQACDKIAEKLN
ncbi:low molecular weight protein-tyrosine-phosphatase [Flavobacteriaceae bacterium 14752]|uniref:low molecular weight protein-tyrosine-phosphatase n=1 Tax=Mesohalobacter salilacus TaxID=2491711 RepID=UPI000F62EC2C|nr:low molecular weight phosphotyrosine protein phosphatase [Flavobacteriaceae bacterium 14752]